MPFSEQQWRAQYAAAVACYGELCELARAPVTQSVEPEDLLARWSSTIRSLDISQLSDDPAFAPPLLEQLVAMNNELQALYSVRREAISQAHNKQKKAHAGINAYRGL